MVSLVGAWQTSHYMVANKQDLGYSPSHETCGVAEAAKQTIYVK